jgi:nitrate reductase NapE component
MKSKREIIEFVIVLAIFCVLSIGLGFIGADPIGLPR